MNEYSIKEQITKYLDTIKKDPIVFNYLSDLENKSKYQREKDIVFIGRIFHYLEQLAKGWVLSNACQTAKLYEANEYLEGVVVDELAEEIAQSIIKRKNELQRKD